MTMQDTVRALEGQAAEAAAVLRAYLDEQSQALEALRSQLERMRIDITGIEDAAADAVAALRRCSDTGEVTHG
jgi:hypothetical protein